MRRRVSRWVVIAALVFVLPLMDHADRVAAQLGPARFLLYAPASEVAGIAGRHGLTAVTPLDQHAHDVFRVTGRDGITPADLLAEVRADAAVVNFELDAPGNVSEASGLQLNNATVAVLDALNNTSLVEYYGLNLWSGFVNQPAVYRIRVPESQQSYATGAGVVAIIDTGVDPNHPLLAPALVPGYDFVHGVPGPASEWSDLSQQLVSALTSTTIAGLDESTVPVPADRQTAVLNNATVAVLDNATVAVLDASQLPQNFGHGSMMAGLVRLVAPTAQIMPLKAFNSNGTAKLFDVIRAIYYATEHSASVIAMGFSMADSSVELTRAINFATSRGVIVVASVGNDGRESLTFPAAVRTTIGVGSTTANDERSLFSNFGNALVRIAAPGESLVTAYPGGRYAAAWGTSFSAALIAGGAALLRQVDPAISPSSAVEYIGTGAVGSTLKLGAGRVDLFQVLRARATGAPPPPPPNTAPTAVNDSATTPQDAPVSIDVRVNDSDPDGNPLTLVSVTQPSHGTAVIATTGPNAGTVTYQPAANFAGTDSFAYTISDGTLTATAVVTVTVTAVNHAPTANNDAATTPAGTEVVIDVLANDADVDGDSLTVTAVGAPQQGSTVLVASGLNAGRISYLPLAGFVGIDQFTYTIGDGRGGTATATVSVTVTAVNRAPAAMNDVATVVEDTATALNVLSNDSDPDGDVLSVSAVTQAAHGSVAVITDGIDVGKVRYTPQANFFGADTFTYTVSDGKSTATAAVTITVSNVNDPPVAVNDSVITPEDTAVSVDVRLNDTDVDGDTLSVTGVSTPGKGTAILLTTGTEAGHVRYTPNANVNGTDSFTYTIDDGHGATATGTVMVTITPVNDPPTAIADAATLLEDSVANIIDVLANDSSSPDAGEVLTVTAVGAAAHGTVSVIAEGVNAGKVSYTPQANFFGTDTFTYTVGDGNGGLATAAVTVMVTAVNDAPVAVNDVATVAEDATVAINVTANDLDVDGDVLGIIAVSTPAHGTATLLTLGPDAGRVSYTPAANFAGADSFTYTVSDGHGGTATASVSVTVTAVNDAPIAANDGAATTGPTAVAIAVLANDVDVDGDPLSVTAIGAPAHGTAALLTSGPDAGKVSYTAEAGFVGSDSFTYTITDGLATATATVTVIVSPGE